MKTMVALSQQYDERQPGSSLFDSLEVTQCAKDIYEARTLSLQRALPSIVDVVLAQHERERLSVIERLDYVSQGLDFLLKASECADTSEKLTELHAQVDDLRSRTAQLFEGSEIPGTVPRLTTNQNVELANALWELRESFWRKLYEVPFVQRRLIEVVEHALENDRRMSRALFAPRRMLVDGDASARDVLLKERAREALRRVRALQDGTGEPDTRAAAIAEVLLSIPLPPEKNLLLMGEYKRRQQSADAQSGEGRRALGLPDDNLLEFHHGLLSKEGRYLRVRNYLVMANAALSHSQSRRFDRDGALAEDVRQAGIVGLVESVERFDATLGFALSTNAKPWIEKELILAGRQEGAAVSVPRAKRKDFFIYRSAGGEPGKIEALVADGVLAADDVTAFAALSRPVRRLSDPVSRSSDDHRLGDMLADDRVTAVDLQLRNEDDRVAVEALLRELPRTEQEIVALAFGLNGLERHGDAEIAERLGLRKDIVRSRRARAIQVLQRRAGRLDA